MVPNPLVEKLFATLAALTAPLKGYRTALGVVAGIALGVYGVISGDYNTAMMAVTMVVTALGLRPDPAPQEA